MNKDNAREYLPLVQALAEGKIVQYKLGDGWSTGGDVDFSLPPHQYRIKPEPREFFMNRYPDGTEDGPFDTAYRASTHLCLNGGVICYREVIE